MGLKLIIMVAVVGAAVMYYLNGTAPHVVSLDQLEQYWGPGDGKNYKEDTTIKPFKINYSNEVIDKLRAKLNDVPKFSKPLEGTAFQYGFNSNRLLEIITYWKTNYLAKWNEREKFLNQFPQFKTQIQGLDIHFIHVKPKVPSGVKVLPLLLLHGWPGSVREFYDIIPMLTSKTEDKNYVFEVIVPSLPGYGWSQAASKQGLSTSKIAVIMKKLMTRIGHKHFYVQGGDWGSLIGNQIATFFQDNVLGVHLNMCGLQSTSAIMKTFVASFMPSLFIENQYVDFYFPAIPKLKEIVIESGYLHLQATKPDTIGAALVGNPIGLAAYILEKFSTWTNPAYRELADGGLEKYYTLDSLLDNIMIYYLTDTITTSQRIYYETFSNHEMALKFDNTQTQVPAACAKFKYELAQTIDWALRDHFINLVQSNHFQDGGHFAAMQLPAVLYKDLVQFVNKVEKKTK
ncbi:juvenile hormone epoxide hydrolase 1-like [Sabethes cyaneus]|uniref:juvenile hormone epoxide hydrolase 1-like n=1 Tax=Sabethes cyaneus TaxID=53552 RepID=UPI00237DD87F|nr:juvenile hormone epoxide hydrolase 1-like [Sabethes cyaneus]XP_053696693.1 juvenile hormone epoxide hydrolase 1-like [Sabethes cyaneus]